MFFICRQGLRHAQRFVARFACVMGVFAITAAGPIQAQTIRAGLTDLTSDTERMISYRHQEHMWQTADGALHLLLNRGTLEPGPGLTLYTSFDAGSTWHFMQAFAATDGKSTGDGQLQGDDLTLVYATSDGAIVFAELHYEASLQAWSIVRSETAYSSTQFIGLNPAHGIDALGAVWCAFVARDHESNDTNIRVINRVGGTTEWTDPGLVFGPTDHRSIERSARPVRIAGGMGMVFTVRESTFWGTRTNDLPNNSAWTFTTVFEGTPEQSFRDPYASHFSVVVDDAGNVHLTIADNYDVFYLRRIDGDPAWSPPLKLDDSRKAVYSQVGLVNGRIAVPFSMQRGRGPLMVSDDLGASFSLAAELALPPRSPGVTYGTARVEMPTRTIGPLTILQEYQDNGVQRLMVFKVPSL